MTYYTIVNELGVPILPLDENPDSEDEGMLVYSTLAAAQAAADYQMLCYNLEDVRPLPLHELEDRLDAQEPQEISVAESLAILFGGLLGLAILVIVAMAVW
jgi:hypothetical protein